MLTDKEVKVFSQLIKDSETRSTKKIEQVLGFNDRQNLYTAKRVSNLEINLGLKTTPEVPQ